MTSTPDPTAALKGRPPVVDQATWQAARDELLAREKAHTREGDAIAAARRRLPMVEFDGTVEVTGPDGPVPFTDLFQGRDELLALDSVGAGAGETVYCCRGREASFPWLPDEVPTETSIVAIVDRINITS